MKHPSQEDLLGYVLGALDAQQHRQVQQLIDTDPELEEQLLAIKTSLSPLDHVESDANPPAGLARRTCELVAAYQNDADSDRKLEQRIAAVAETESDPENTLVERKPTFSSNFLDRAAHPRSWSMADMLVGLAICAVFAGVLLPAVSYTRYNSRLLACQDNMRQLGQAMIEFSNSNEGRFIEIPRAGPLARAGIYAPTLKDMGYITDDTVFRCAGLGCDLPAAIPAREQIAGCGDRDQLQFYHLTMGGDYGYSLGYIESNRYCTQRNLGQSFCILLADSPSFAMTDFRSENHGGNGQNCLFQDGRVEFIKGHAFGKDPIYRNDFGIMSAGAHSRDNVIGPSHISPIMQAVQYDAAATIN